MKTVARSSRRGQMKSINIVTVNNGVGLTRSARILAHALHDGGHAVHVQNLPEDYRRRPTVPPADDTYDVNIFMERVYFSWLDAATTNCLVPNQEWFGEEQYADLVHVDWVLCKTHYAQTIFDELHCRTAFISFTSEDCFDAACQRNDNGFFHLAGRSLQKGTEILIETWERRPDWPELVIVQHPETQLSVNAANITYHNQYVDEGELRRYQNEYAVHLCPSEAEGFGHSIVEGLSCCALTLTTDAPPMNELVTADRGVLVPYQEQQAQGLGTNYYVDTSALETAIAAILDMDHVEKRNRAEAGRIWYEENDRFFRHRVVDVMKEI